MGRAVATVALDQGAVLPPVTPPTPAPAPDQTADPPTPARPARHRRQDPPPTAPRARRGRPRSASGKPVATGPTGRRRLRGDLAATVAGVGGGFALGSTVVVMRPFWGTPGGPSTVLGSLTAIAGTYLCLMLLLLISRLPWLEREVGHDRMLAWHRHLAPWSLLLIGAHVMFTALGYSQGAGIDPLTELWRLVTRYPWMVPAAVAFVTMVALGVVSWRPIRTRMSYETWWVAHLYFYLAVALAFGHQVNTGLMFTTHPGLRYAWTGLYVAVGTTILVCRVLLPLRLSLRHRLRVLKVVDEAPGVVSVYLTGRDLAGLSVSGGQFFQWRFLTRHWWWQAHPYSLSAAPSGSHLRITVKHLGDQSGHLPWGLRPGTRVLAEGPYGTFTADSRSGDRVAAFAAGVGITPVRAMLDDLPASCDVTLVYRVSSLERVALQSELEAMAEACGWTLVLLDGPRTEHPMTLNYLTRFVPDLSDRDVYVCGPAPFADSVLAAARSAKVPAHRLHCESFTF
jgi:predicted ferric reductase